MTDAPHGEPEHGEPEDREPAPAEPDTKSKFRAVLERKRAAQRERNAAAKGTDPAAIHGVHGPAAQKRSFRRKSG